MTVYVRKRGYIQLEEVQTSLLDCEGPISSKAGMYVHETKARLLRVLSISITLSYNHKI